MNSGDYGEKPVKIEAGKPRKRSKIIMALKLVWFSIRIGTAFLLIFVGMFGLIMPVLPGWVLMIPGFALLYREILMLYRGIRDWLFRKFPILERIIRLAFPEKPKKPAGDKKIKAGPKSLEKQVFPTPVGKTGSGAEIDPGKAGKL